MISGRSHRDWPRMIVRRTRPAVGAQRPRTVVRRSSGGVSAPESIRIGREPVIGAHHRWPFSWQWTLLGTAALLVVVVFAAGLWAWRSSFFRISDVAVTGTDSRLSVSSVITTARLDGASMFTADLSAAEQRVSRLPLVASVQMTRQWPHTVAITVNERQPWGTWVQNQQDYIIDRHGVVIGLGRTADGSPVIASSGTGNLQLGSRVNYQAVDASAEIYTQLPNVLHTTVAKVAFVAGSGVEVTLADGTTGLFGDSSSIDYKLAVWEAVRQQAQARHIHYTTVDLRYGNRPVLR